MHSFVRVTIAVLIGTLAVAAVVRLVSEDPTPSGSEALDRVEPASASAAGAGAAYPLQAPLSATGPAPAARGRPHLAAVEVARRNSRALASSSLVIRVLDGLDGPLAGAEVTLRAGARQGTRVTGGDGEAAFEGLAPGGYGYRVAAPGRPPLMAAAPVRLAAGEMRRLEVRIADHDRVLAGSVVDTDSVPVAGLTVKARAFRPPTSAAVLVPVTQAEQTAATTADGAFEIVGLADGEYRLRVVASERYGSAEMIVRPRADPVLLVVKERRELTVFGAVTDADGAALANALVVDLERPSRRVRTDEDGWYELVVEARESPRFQVTAGGHRRARVALDAAASRAGDEARLDIALEALAERVAVAARVTDGAGAPVAGERVYLSSSALGTHYQAVSDAGGGVWFPAVAWSPDYGVRVLPRGRYQNHAQAAVDLDAPIEIELAALSAGTLGGRMIDVDGAPVPHLSLRVESVEARGKARQVTGDASGYFELEEVPAGPLIVSAAAPRHRISGVRLDGGGMQEVELVLDWGERVVEGRVVDTGERPLPGATVALVWTYSAGSLHGRAERSTLADAGGRFTFSQLGPGTHHLEVSASGYQRRRQILEATAAWAEIRLEPME